jgi:predicted HicB family RNase H-like nuclease
MATPPKKRGPGRPRDALPERIQVRLSTEELAEWTRAATADGRTLSTWIRAMLNKAARHQK